jgi:hypothetical protein
MSVLRALVVLAIAGVLAGCSTHPAGPVTFHELRLAKSFKLLPIFWVGKSFDGLTLTAADDGYDYDPTIGMRVYYGDCAKRGSFATGGCKLPLTITSVIYEPHSNRGLGLSRASVIRGVPAVSFDAGRAIELYTGHIAIDVRADSPHRARAAAELLLPLNVPGSAGKLLPPPQFRPGVANDPRAKAIAGELRAQPTEPTLAAPQLLPRRG